MKKEFPAVTQRKAEVEYIKKLEEIMRIAHDDAGFGIDLDFERCQARDCWVHNILRRP